MSQVIEKFLPALASLIAAIVVAWIGYTQWKRQHQFDRSRAFFDEKRIIYKQLWERMEAIHIKLRSGSISGEEFNDKVRVLNTFIIKSEIYLDKGLSSQINQYLETLFSLIEAVKESGDDFLQQGVRITRPRSQTNIIQMQKTRNLYQEVESQRELILKHFRGVMSNI